MNAYEKAKLDPNVKRIPRTQQTLFKCPICDAGFNSASEYCRHANHKHADKTLDRDFLINMAKRDPL
jgi:uncharacterized C2H2 Zn-finger protein